MMRRKATDRFRQWLILSVLMHGALLGILAVAMTSPQQTTLTMRVFLVGEEAALVRGRQQPPGKSAGPPSAIQAAAAAAPQLPRIALDGPPSRRDAALPQGSKGTLASPVPGRALAAPASAGQNASADGAATVRAAASASPVEEPSLPEAGNGAQAPPAPGHALVAPAGTGENAGREAMPSAFTAAAANPLQGPVQPPRGGSEPGSDMVLGEAGAPTFIHREAPQYPLLARQLGKEGRVVLRVALDSRGNLQNIEVVQSDGFGFAEAASTAIRKSTFAPAFKNGRSVPVNVIVPVRFVLN